MGAEIGMLIVETIAKIRRLFFAQGKSIKAICRELRLSRKVAAEDNPIEGDRVPFEREAQPLPKIGPWSDKLDQLLLVNEAEVIRGVVRACLCGSHRHPPGRARCRRASPLIRPWRHGL
jgi:hypothetical protein